MTGLIGSGGLRVLIQANDPDGVIQPIFWRVPEAVWIRQPDFISPWWPGRVGLMGENGLSGEILEGTWFEQPEKTSGVCSRYGFVGVTRDQYGSALGGVTVKLFRTLNDEKVDEIVSDPSGNFLVGSPYYPEGHYLVFYKTGVPDVTGASVNTLIGA